MRHESDKARLEKFMAALGERVRGPGRIYLVGGGTAVLEGWRETTIDIDLKADPEPGRFFEAIAELKEAIAVNVELAAPDDFIPPLPGWRERSRFVARHGSIDFYHYDFYAQALAKLERGHERDLDDVRAMLDRHLITCSKLTELFQSIEGKLIRYPAVNAGVFRESLFALCGEPTDNSQ